MAFTRRIQIDDEPWRNLTGEYDTASFVLAVSYDIAARAIERGARRVKVQILQGGIVLFELSKVRIEERESQVREQRRQMGDAASSTSGKPFRADVA